MNRIKKFAAALTAFSVAATMAACSSPTIGSGSANAVTIDDYEVRSGIFIFYTLTAYFEASDILSEDSGVTPTADEIEDAHIDNLEAKEWIQNKATEYCADFVAIEKEFDKIGGELSEEDIDSVESQIEQVDEIELYSANGIGKDSAREIALNSYKRQYVFDYYYGFDGEWGMSEDELKDYFDDNFARVKYVTLSYLDSDGNELDESGKKEIRELAYDYADRINEESDVMDKLYEMNDVMDDYSEYVEEQAAALNTDTATTTTTTTTTTTATETTTTTTTTTNPYENEQLIQKVTTTTVDSSDSAAVTGTTTTQSASQKSSENLSKFVFNELEELNKAVVFDDEENNNIYVVIRADLRDRMKDDDLWSEDYITALQSMNFNEDFADYIEDIVEAYSVKRNKSAYRRYSPFKLTVETSQ